MYLGFFSWLIYKTSWFHIDGLNPKLVVGAFWLKLLFGFLFWTVYNYHYPVSHDSDAFAYFEEAKILNSVFYENPGDFFRLMFSTNPSSPDLLEYTREMDRWNRAVSYGVLNDNPTIIKFNAIVLFFSLGFYHTHTIFMAFVCFSGLLLIFRFLEKMTDQIPKLFLLAALMLPPSLLFWSGGVLKEGLLIFGLGLLFYSLTLLREKNFIKGFVLIIAALFLLLFTKTYVLIAFAPGLIFLVLTLLMGNRGIWWKFAGIHVLLFAIVFTLGYWVNDYDVLAMFQQKQQDFYNIGDQSEIGSLIEIPPIRNTFDLILNAPTALFNTYFRPHLLEAHNVTFLAAAIENLFYGVLLLTAILRFNRPSRENAIMALTSLSFILGLGLLVGLITPVLGAVVRYKIPALPFLVVFCFLIMQPTLTSVNLFLKKHFKQLFIP